jgi:hypothetical protein
MSKDSRMMNISCMLIVYLKSNGGDDLKKMLRRRKSHVSQSPKSAA